MALRIEGGQVLLGHEIADVPLLVEDGTLLVGGGAGGAPFDARGLLVLPGIVDLHGDAFERQMQPRPGVDFPPGLALADTEAQLLASGITTAFHAATLSWEPGLRGAAAWRGLLDTLGGREWACDMRVHMRWELHNLQALDMALADVAGGRVHLVSFNDHTPAMVEKLATASGAAKYSQRAGMGVEAFRALAEEALAHGPGVDRGTRRLAEAARAAGLPMASHDDDSPATRARFRALGAGICEFPVTEEVARAACEAGDAVVMGCPNVVRGGSHLGWASAAATVERGLCSVLVSDYYYPAMAQAALILAERIGLGRAWGLISAGPAAAAGLGDRGQIATGKRADLVLLDRRGTAVATVAGGAVAHLSREGWRRLQQR